MAPKRAARGLVASEEAAPVLSGTPPDEVEVAVDLVPVAERERVAEVTVVLVPADGRMEAETLEMALLSSAEADEAADAAADEAEA